MDKLQHERRQGDELFGEMVAEIQQYIHRQFLATRRVPSKDQVLADMDYIGMPLHKFLNGVQGIAPAAVTRFIDRLDELVRVAQYEYKEVVA